MTINKGGKGPVSGSFESAFNEAESAQRSAQQAAGASEQPQRPPQNNKPFVAKKSVLDINQRMRRAMSRKSTGEIVQAYQTAFNDTIEKNFKEGFESGFKLLVMENTPGSGTVYSSFLLCLSEKIQGVNHSVVYTFIIEDSGPDKLNSRILNVGGRSVETELTTGDVYNDNFWRKISDHVRTTIGEKCRST